MPHGVGGPRRRFIRMARRTRNGNFVFARYGRRDESKSVCVERSCSQGLPFPSQACGKQRTDYPRCGPDLQLMSLLLNRRAEVVGKPLSLLREN